MKRLHSLFLILCLVLGLVACGKAPTWQEQYDLGVRYLSEGNYQEAIIAFTAAIEIDPKQENAYIGLADAYIGTGDTEKAVEILEQAVEVIGETQQLADAQKRIKALTIPELTASAKEIFDICYQGMKNRDYQSISKFSYLEQPLSVRFFDENIQYDGLCYDGESLSADMSGTGLKMWKGEHIWYLYYGDMINGVPNGNGICGRIYRFGWDWREEDPMSFTLFDGEWRDGKPNGNGILVDWKGNTANEQCRNEYEGNWTNGLLDGEARVLDVNGEYVFEERYYFDNGKGNHSSFENVIIDFSIS